MPCPAPLPPGGAARSAPPARSEAVAPTPPPPSSADGGASHVAEPDGAEAGGDEAESDYTRLPAILDARLSALKVDTALRPTTIKLGSTWTRKAQKALLGAPTTETLAAEAQKDETQRRRTRHSEPSTCW